jgi:hypothetical protein
MADQYCVKCGQALSATHLFCSGCGTRVETPAGPSLAKAAGESAPASAAPAAPTDNIPSLANFARIAKTIALLSFLLPWVTVSCAGQPLVSINGLSLISGRMTMRDPMSGAVRTQHGSAEVLILLAVLAIGIALFVSFVLPRRRAALAAIWSSSAALLMIVIEVFVRIPAAVRQSAARGGRGNRFDPSMDAMISVNGAIGFWLCVLALAAAIALHWYIRRQVPPDPPG